MQLSFSTLACPDWSLEQMIAGAARYGFGGVALRSVGGELDLAQAAELQTAGLAGTRARFDAAGIAVSMVLTSARLIVAEDEVEDNMALAERHIDIAAGLGAPAIRVFGGQFPIGLSHAAAVMRAGALLRRLGDYARPRGVMVLLETHDDFTDPSLLRRVMQAADHTHVGAVWDTHHPFRIFGSRPQAVWEAIGPWVRAVDIKDSITDFSARLGYRYVPLGEGDVPVGETLGVLEAGGYDGWLTFEWERLWHPELEAPEIALPCFVASMHGLLAEMAVGR